ncbi:MAG: IPT/TIG domain-containing protein, partial [Candidatus Omnitrophica bacterium]|nr:IPT/TIG domain-containing protein [Candidatus Omnitrophota bacterium]
LLGVVGNLYGPPVLLAIDFTNDGEIVEKWRQATEYAEGISITDFDSDGYPEIILSLRDLYNTRGLITFNSYGNELWRYYLPSQSYLFSLRKARDVAIADINGDGKVEVVRTFVDYKNSRNVLCQAVWDKNGKEITEYRRFISIIPDERNKPDGSLAIADINRDGKVEIVTPTGDNFLVAYTLDTPYNASTMDWPMDRHDIIRSGEYTGEVIIDSTPPTTPVVTDEGQYTTLKNQLSCSWASDDPQTGIVEYQYKITQDSISGPLIKDWTSTGTNISITATGLSLLDTKTYYFSVRAKNGVDLWSNIGYSDGIQCLYPPTITSISPTLGIPGALITINGNYFRLRSTLSKVEFTQSATRVNATIAKWANTVISCYVPYTLAKGQCQLRVINANGQTEAKTFTIVLPPTIMITTPKASSYVPYTGFPFKGTASGQDGATITEVIVSVYDYKLMKYTVNNVKATYNTLTKEWSYNVLSTQITPGATLYLRAQAKDSNNVIKSVGEYVYVQGVPAVD